MGLQGLLPLTSEFGYPNSMLATTRDSRPVLGTESDFSVTDWPEKLPFGSLHAFPVAV